MRFTAGITVHRVIRWQACISSKLLGLAKRTPMERLQLESIAMDSITPMLVVMNFALQAIPLVFIGSGRSTFSNCLLSLSLSHFLAFESEVQMFKMFAY